jgi:hypothetical protein
MKAIYETFVGKLIGSGMSRKVYECTIDDTLVIKIEDKGFRQNIIEYEIYNASAGFAPSKWLAPCVFISKCGRVLLQKKTIPVRKNEVPAKVPSWLTDFKLSNFGIYNGKFVCHDYGTTLITNYVFSNKMKKFDYY